MTDFLDTEVEVPGTMLIRGLCGSKAYGLDTPTSDEDWKGVFVVPTEFLLGLRKIKETLDHTDPDYSYQEVGKFFRLALAANPTILEILFLTENVTYQEPWGREIWEHRDIFLSNRVRHSYGGYAVQQARKLQKRQEEGKPGFSSDTKNRYAKHARHCFRLLQQGKALLETGELTVRVSNRDELFAIGELPVDRLVAKFEDEFDYFNESTSVLPDQPDYVAADNLLRAIRLDFLGQ